MRLFLSIFLICAPLALWGAVGDVTKSEKPQASALVENKAALSKEFKDTSKIVQNIIRFASGPTSGVYFPAAGSICRIINQIYQNDIRCGVYSTSGSLENLKGGDSDLFDVAIVQSDFAKSACNGEFGDSLKDLRFLFALHDESLSIAVRSDSSVNSIKDLAGKKVNLGDEASSVRKIMQDVLRLHDVAVGDVNVTSLSPQAQAKALCDGEINAMVLMTGHPNGAINNASSMCDIRFISPVNEKVLAFLKGRPGLFESSINGAFYKNMRGNVKTIGLRAFVVAKKGVDDALIYAVTKAVFDNFDGFKLLHAVFSGLDKGIMSKSTPACPMHEGSKRYFAEKNML